MHAGISCFQIQSLDSLSISINYDKEKSEKGYAGLLHVVLSPDLTKVSLQLVVYHTLDKDDMTPAEHLDENLTRLYLKSLDL